MAVYWLGSSWGGVKSPGVDAGKNGGRNWGNGERERRLATKRWAMNTTARRALLTHPNHRRRVALPFPRVLFIRFIIVLIVLDGSGAVFPVATTPWPSSLCPTARPPSHARIYRRFIVFIVATQGFVVCALGSRTRVGVHWHGFLRATGNVVIGIGGLCVCCGACVCAGVDTQEAACAEPDGAQVLAEAVEEWSTNVQHPIC